MVNIENSRISPYKKKIKKNTTLKTVMSSKKKKVKNAGSNGDEQATILQSSHKPYIHLNLYHLHLSKLHIIPKDAM